MERVSGLEVLPNHLHPDQPGDLGERGLILGRRNSKLYKEAFQSGSGQSI